MGISGDWCCMRVYCNNAPTDNFVLSLFPFATPFQIFVTTEMTQAMHYIYAAIIEIVVIGIAELVFIKVRRSFE